MKTFFSIAQVLVLLFTLGLTATVAFAVGMAYNLRRGNLRNPIIISCAEQAREICLKPVTIWLTLSWKQMGRDVFWTTGYLCVYMWLDLGLVGLLTVISTNVALVYIAAGPART